MKLPRRNFLHLAAGAAALPALAHVAVAQTYPSRPVRIVVGLAAGSASDIVARLIGQRLSEQLGQPFVVENRPGANGLIATQGIAQSEADGHTILFGTMGNLASNAVLYAGRPGADMERDFMPLAHEIGRASCRERVFRAV